MPHREPLPLPLTKLRRQHPFQVSFATSALIAGILLAVSGTRPQSIAASMPGLVQGAWQVMLIVGGGVGLVAAVWRGQPSTAIAVELGALVILGGALTMYTIAVFAVAGMAAIASGSFIAAFAAACWWRSTQIARSVRAYTIRHRRQQRL